MAALVAEQGSHLRVAASLTIAEHLLPGWLSALREESPDVILAVEVTNSSQVLARVRDGSVDVGFVEGDQVRLEGMMTVAVRSDHLVVGVDPRHPWARRATAIGGAALAAADLIVREHGSGTRQVLDHALSSRGGARSCRQEFTIVLTARATGGAPTPSDESSEVRWVPRDDLDSYSMDRSMRLRIGHFHAGRGRPHLG